MSHEAYIVLLLEVFGNLLDKYRGSLVYWSLTIYDMHTILLSEDIISFDNFGLELFEALDDIVRVSYIHTCFVVLEWVTSDGTLSGNLYRYTEVKCKIRGREVVIIKWL